MEGSNHILIFDVDNTLTPPRRPLETKMGEALKSLRIPFAIAAGSTLELVRDQFLVPLHTYGFRGEFEAFLCNGASQYHCSLADAIAIDVVSEFSIREHLGDSDYPRILAVLEHVLNDPQFTLPSPMKIIGERIIDRGSMLNVAPIGRPTGPLSPEAYRNRDNFVHYDRQTKYRQKFRSFLTEELADLITQKSLVIAYGGQTSIDINVKGFDKSNALVKLQKRGYEKLTYIGDALFEGGNDEAVLKYISSWENRKECPIEAIKVENCNKTYEILCNLNLFEGAGAA